MNRQLAADTLTTILAAVESGSRETLAGMFTGERLEALEEARDALLIHGPGNLHEVATTIRNTQAEAIERADRRNAELILALQGAARLVARAMISGQAEPGDADYATKHVRALERDLR